MVGWRLGFLSAFLCALGWAQAVGRVDFERDVRAVFAARCNACHGQATETSGLRLDDPEQALKGGFSGPAIRPGDSAGSQLVRRIARMPGVPPMPPSGPPLTAREVGVIRAWIDQGAPYPKQRSIAPPPATKGAGHWSFQALQRPPLPEVARRDWVRTPVDRFVLARLEKEALAPSSEAPKHVLLRRLSFDLTGLPPTPDELSAFLADSSSAAWERQVDRLLASPHFGEKWARQWLDLARYGDSDGYEKDWVRPYAWRYREWVIQALNSGMPFDQFTIEQLAGDLLPNATVEQRVATGFHRNTRTNREGGVDNEQFRFENVVDRAATTGTVWLGLTMGCAQCHNHKFDPTTQKDFYSLAAFFDHVEERQIDAPLPGELGPWLAGRDEYRKKRQALLAEYRVADLQPGWEKEMLEAAANPGKRTDWDLAWDCLLKLTSGGDGEQIIRKPSGERTEREVDVLTTHFIKNYHFAVGGKRYKEVKFKELDDKLTELKKTYPQLTQAEVLAAPPAREPSYLRVRGDYKARGIEVHPNTPAFLGNPVQTNATRLDLARWLVSKDNPLTARVAVNRVWQELFGQGIVKTSDDFGLQGDRPSHPELLDWLAAEFANGWNVKQLIRTIVTSSAYMQSSRVRQDLETKDPSNVLLARQSRLRLSAEAVRDEALFVSGLLNPRVGGPSVRPYQPAGVAELGYANSVKWEPSSGADAYRRGLYIHFQRTTPYPLLANFDAPKGDVPVCRRLRSNTALQALNLLNDPAFMEAAAGLAFRLEQDAAAAEPRIRRAFALVLNREPTAGETSRLIEFVERQHAQFRLESVEGAEHAAWVALASVLLNLDEFITRE